MMKKLSRPDSTDRMKHCTSMPEGCRGPRPLLVIASLKNKNDTNLVKIATTTTKTSPPTADSDLCSGKSGEWI